MTPYICPHGRQVDDGETCVACGMPPRRYFVHVIVPARGVIEFTLTVDEGELADAVDKATARMKELNRGDGELRHVGVLPSAAPRSQRTDPDAHPCVIDGCDYTVQFDDEPWCYKHSPDEGSSVRGYSYKASHPGRIPTPGVGS